MRCWTAAPTRSSSRSPRVTGRGPRPTRPRRASPARTAPTRTCSPTPTSTRSTTRCPTRCTSTGRSARCRRASTCSARSRCRAGLRMSSAPSTSPTRRAWCLPRRSCGATTRRPRRPRELVASGAIGELRTVRAAFAFRRDDPSDVRLQAALDGGGLMDVGCYCISGCRTLAGAEPERGLPRGPARRRRGRRGRRCAAALPGRRLRALRLRPGLSRAAHTSARSAPTASSSSATPGTPTSPVIELRRDGATERIEVGRGENSYALELADFAAAAAGEREPLLGRADALGQARTIAALYHSAEKGTPCPIT